MIDGTKWDFFSERKTSMSQDRIVFFDPFFANAFINEIKSLNL